MTKTIDVSGLSKSYAGNKIIDRLSLTVASGEIYGLLGANGAGKSTTIECLLGTKQADAGTIRILGLDPYKDRQQLFEQVGVQFQEAHYPQQIKVKELCEETACLYQDAANYQTLLRQFALIEKANALVSDLSGGQRQKLFILLALLAKPKVLFLDELTTGLDPKARRDIWQSIQELKRHGLTIFLSSHFMDEVETLCDRISILKNGRLSFTGTIPEAIAQSPYDNFEESYLWFIGEEIR